MILKFWHVLTASMAHVALQWRLQNLFIFGLIDLHLPMSLESTNHIFSWQEKLSGKRVPVLFRLQTWRVEISTYDVHV